MPVLELSGVSEGFAWKVSVQKTASGEFYALVKVGSTVRITHNFMLAESARDAGCFEMSDMLAEKMEESHV